MEKTYQDYFEQQYLTGENIIASNKLEGKYLSLNDNNIRLSESNSFIQNDLSVENELSALSLSVNNKIKLSETQSFIQPSLTVGDNTTANSNAIAEFKSNTKGLILPILTNNNRDNLDDVEGLIIYNSDEKSIEYNTGSIWKSLKPSFTPFIGFLDIDNAVNGGYGYPNAQNLQSPWSSNKNALLRRNFTMIASNIVTNQSDGDNAFYVRYDTPTSVSKGKYKLHLKLGKDNTSPVINLYENINNITLLSGEDLHTFWGDGDDKFEVFDADFYFENEADQNLQFEIDCVANTNPSFDYGYLLILQGGYLSRIE